MIEEKKIDVGPIRGDYEAYEKVNKYMLENNMSEEEWLWSGSWTSEGCWIRCGSKSYAVFWRLNNAQSTSLNQSQPVDKSQPVDRNRIIPCRLDYA